MQKLEEISKQINHYKKIVRLANVKNVLNILGIEK